MVIAVALLGGCGTDVAPPESPDPPTSATPSPTGGASGGKPDLASVRIELEQVATLEQPLAMAVRPGSPGLYVAQKTGEVVHLQRGSVDPAAVLDLSGQVSLGSEQGLLGLVFSPDGRELFVNYTDTNGDTHVTAFVMDGTRADPSTRREVLFVDQPFVNHNGGNLAFGPDGYLYVGLGDGGSGGDPQGNGQSLSTLLGKMLRIEPRSVEGRGYAVPPTNPFVGRSGARPEIWAFGLRNPWRYSFDRRTGDLWIADVGQGEWEEIDLQPAESAGGENYGWDRLEGSHPFEGTAPEGAVDPVFEYSHEEGGCTVTGGYVYRGSAIPELYGAYVFGDYCLGRLEAIRVSRGRVVQHRELGPVVQGLSSFGEDARGELYAMSLAGAVYRLVPKRS